jgi:NAD(P)-dependent dehydrogenase (short-subunit alcohol dehydrogenase family)
MASRVNVHRGTAPPPSVPGRPRRGTLERRVALVTGGAQGIGRAIATRFLAAGMRVLVADADGTACRTVERELANDELRAVRCDVARESSVRRAVTAAVRWGGGLDVLVANAGIGMEAHVPLERHTLASWRRVIDTNLTGVFLCARESAVHLRARRGAIVTIASTRALQSEPNTLAYSASKGGVVALTHALAVSLGREVRVNCISPGWIAVDAWKKPGRRSAPELTRADHAQHPAGRVGKPEDIAELALFLVGHDSGFITGANVVCDGGMTRKMIYA